jgi:TonB-dependent receptor
MKTRAFNRRPVAQAISLILGSTVLGSTLTQAAEQEATNLDEIVVTGIRSSLESSMRLKRDAQGVVDGIVAEDIGKFPDTNLAESLQRISGVSIDRSIGEGSRVTVRGVGPDFNLVLLNGRQMPGSSLQDTGASNSRSFDFANLASEAIAAVEVYKTSRSETPTGGIGASINIKTTRPLSAPGLHTSIGVKAVNDTSSDNLPNALQGDSFTPEISGIFSNTFADGKFGVALSASYQERDLGFNQAAVGNGWRPFAGDENNWGTIPQPGNPGSENITNRPDASDTYSVPQNLGYSVNGIERKRTNGQLTLQFQPVDALTATLDYTYSENKVAQQRNELSVWFNFGPSVTSWTDGPVAAPILYSETINGPGFADLSMGGAKFATKNENESLGFNLNWEVNDRLGFALDFHDSSAESGSDSPYGSNAVLGAAGFYRGTTTADFSADFPVMSVVLPPGQTGIDAAQMLVTGSSFRNSYMLAEIQQGRLDGHFDFTEASRLDFGVAMTEVNNRSAFSNVQRDSWGGVGDLGDYPDDVWIPDTVRPYFDNISGSSNPNLFNEFFTWDFETMRQLAATASTATVAAAPEMYQASPDFTTDRRTKEDSNSAYVQYVHNFDTKIPIEMALGLRYEKTEVTSSALVPTATGINWVANNEFSVIFSSPGFTTLDGEYDYVLPSADFAFDVRDDMKVRLSYGETIGRPGWGDIQGGQTLNQLARINGGSGAQGNPGLKPLESKNYDLSFEWYYDEGSYLSVGYFKKDIDNYVGISTITETPFDLPHPGQGAYFDEAVASGCGSGDLTCIRNFIFDNHAGDPGVTAQGVDANGNRLGIIAGQPGDPIATFDITVPANQRSAELDGWELAVQHMFGDSGFGVYANVTLVDSDLTYDNQDRGDQFALEGLSDSYNVVAFFEKNKWAVRAAYNWRDEFLTGRFDGTGLPNPVYTEPYGQLDLNASYSPTDNLSFQIEAINLTDEIQRLHGRADNQALFVTQTGVRYMLGARYTFGR